MIREPERKTAQQRERVRAYARACVRVCAVCLRARGGKGGGYLACSRLVNGRARRRSLQEARGRKNNDAFTYKKQSHDNQRVLGRLCQLCCPQPSNRRNNCAQPAGATSLLKRKQACVREPGRRRPRCWSNFAAERLWQRTCVQTGRIHQSKAVILDWSGAAGVCRAARGRVTDWTVRPNSRVRGLRRQRSSMGDRSRQMRLARQFGEKGTRQLFNQATRTR